MPDSHNWWQTGIVYQIYPRSFQDSDGDGIGDLRGIRQRLDYFEWLGIDAIWISPIYPSPIADFGYDVSDYTDVHPMFGNLDDLDALIADVHGRGMKLILDWVPNHTSDQHPWFIESRSSRDNPKRDWYMWADPGPDGGPPNNWLAVFGGSAWEWDEATGQYYYHAFVKEQPDLNWRNPDKNRLATRIGLPQARVAAMLLLTLRGTPTIYQGEELGMENVPVPPEMVQDPFGKAFPEYGRDPVRTPMQWDTSANAGFTGGDPWLPLEDDFSRRNVASQREDPSSMLSLYHDLIALRRFEPALTIGSYRGVESGDSLVTYTREHTGRSLLVALNLESEPAEFSLPESFRKARVLISTNRQRDGEQVRNELLLAGDEGLVLQAFDEAESRT